MYFSDGKIDNNLSNEELLLKQKEYKELLELLFFSKQNDNRIKYINILTEKISDDVDFITQKESSFTNSTKKQTNKDELDDFNGVDHSLY